MKRPYKKIRTSKEAKEAGLTRIERRHFVKKGEALSIVVKRAQPEKSVEITLPECGK